MPDAAACVTAALLERNAAIWPDLVVLKFDSGQQFNSVQLLGAVRRRAAGLQALGVQQGEFVLSWFANGPDAVLNWLALNLLGAVYVPINTAYRGNLLQHVIATSGATVMLADGTFIERIATVRTARLARIVVTGEQRPQLPGIALLDASVLAADAAHLQAPLRPIQPWDTQCVIFTSGTTGPSKGVLCSYRHTYTAAVEFRHVGPCDTNLVALPMFHIGGVLGVNFALIHGGTAAVVERFRTQTFWQTVRELGVTATGLLGTMVQFLMQQPVEPGEREHPLKKVVIAPFGEEALAYAKRFGVDVFTEFNMTELSVPLWAGPEDIPRNSCGRPRQGVTLRLVDANDVEVAPGAVGELILRTDEPWTLCHGYLNEPEATARAWRNGWFHTGDLFRVDAGGNYYFVDRAKDMIRRRGENISSFEVEAELLAFPGVRAAAAVPVPGDGGEHEVLAVLSLQQGAQFSPGALIDFLQPRMAAFMIPRYVRVVPEMPLTPTQKIEKHVLRAAGITADTWDRGTGRWRDIGTAQPFAAGDRIGADLSAPDRRGPLAGIRVLEFSALGPAPFCAMLFGDLGADVLCIDRPGARYIASDVEARGRTRVQLDLKDPAQQAQALLLADQADVLIEGFRPGVMERLGLGPDVVLARNPRLVYGRMTGWGQNGPLAHKAGHDLNYLALTGALHAMGTRERPAIPLNLIGDFGGGALYLALGVLAAMHHARTTGTGQVVDAAMTEGVISLMGMIYGDFADGRWIDARESNPIDGAAPFYNVYQCRDGKWLAIAAIEPQFYRELWQVLAQAGATPGEPVPQLLAAQWQRETWPALRGMLSDIFTARARDEWCELFAGHDACVAPVLSLAEAPRHPHNKARHSFVEIDGITQPAAAPRLGATPGSLGSSPHVEPIPADEALRNWTAPSRYACCMSDQIRFDNGAAYERYMGKWSQLVGAGFLDWLNPPPQQRWLDVGCGNGAFTEMIAARCAPAAITGIDPAAGVLEFARTRPALAGARIVQGDAMSLPFPDASFDVAVMPLVIFFVPDPAKGVAEMARVTAPGGIVTAYGWDMENSGFPYAAVRDELCQMGFATPEPPSRDASRPDLMLRYWQAAGLTGMDSRVFTVQRTFGDFDDYWTTVLGGPSTSAALKALQPAGIAELQGRLQRRLPADGSGRITYAARANAIMGRVPAKG